MAKIISKTQFAGVGSIVQLVGVLMAVVSTIYYGDDGLIIGGLAGLVLLVIGSAMSKVYLCSECHNPVANAKVKVCPICNINFREK